MGMKLFIWLLLLLSLTSDGTSFGRKRSAKCRRYNAKILGQSDENSTTDYYYDCDPTEFGIVQKIPYLRSYSACDTVEIDFSSACVRCGMCLAIAAEINKTLIDVHEVLPHPCLNETEVELLLRTICDHSFQYYGFREIDGRRLISDRLPGSILVTTSADGLWGKRLRDLCHYYLDEIGEVQLYGQWKQWCNDEDGEIFPDLSNVMCRSEHGILRDCRSMMDIKEYESPFKTYNAKIKITATYDKYGKRN